MVVAVDTDILGINDAAAYGENSGGPVGTSVGNVVDRVTMLGRSVGFDGVTIGIADGVPVGIADGVTVGIADGVTIGIANGVMTGEVE